MLSILASLRRGAWYALALITTLPAAAGNFSIAPVRVELQGAQRTAVLAVHNDDDQPLIIQATGLSWSQSNGEDQTDATHDLLVTPPVFTIAAKAEQVLRIGLRTAPDQLRERDYRLLLAEVPGPPDKDFTGLRLALRLSIPVFVAPGSPAAAQLQWQAQRQADDSLAVTATNNGNAHLQVTDFRLYFGGASVVVPVTVSRYVLPGSSVSWQVTPPASAAADAALSVHGSSDAGEFQADVVTLGR